MDTEIIAYNTTTGRFISNPKRVTDALSWSAAHYHAVEAPAETGQLVDSRWEYIVDTPERSITVSDWRTARKLCALYHTDADAYYALVAKLNAPTESGDIAAKAIAYPDEDLSDYDPASCASAWTIINGSVENDAN